MRGFGSIYKILSNIIGFHIHGYGHDEKKKKHYKHDTSQAGVQCSGLDTEDNNKICVKIEGKTFEEKEKEIKIIITRDEKEMITLYKLVSRMEMSLMRSFSGAKG